MSLASATRGDGRVVLLARGASLDCLAATAEGEQYGAWESLGGALAGAPCAVTDGAGRVHVVARQSDGCLAVKHELGTLGGPAFRGASKDERWSAGWTRLSEERAEGPVLVRSARSPGLQLFARCADGGLLHVEEDPGAGWSAPRTRRIEAALAVTPAVAEDAEGRWVVAARDAEGAVIVTRLRPSPMGGLTAEPWRALGDSLGAGTLELALPEGERTLWLVQRDARGQVRLARERDAGSGTFDAWVALPELPVAARSTPRVVHRRSGPAAVVVVALDGSVQLATTRPHGRGFEPWREVGRRIASRLAWARGPRDAIELFGCGADGAVWTGRQASGAVARGTWTKWSCLGGVVELA